MDIGKKGLFDAAWEAARQPVNLGLWAGSVAVNAVRSRAHRALKFFETDPEQLVKEALFYDAGLALHDLRRAVDTEDQQLQVFCVGKLLKTVVTVAATETNISDQQTAELVRAAITNLEQPPEGLQEQDTDS